MRLREFAPSPDRDHNDDVPDPIFVLANRWWNATDRQPQIEHVLNSLGWSIHQVESEDDAVQLQHRDGTTYFISADDFDPDLFEYRDNDNDQTVHRDGLDLESIQVGRDFQVTASSHGRELAMVMFQKHGDTLVPQNLEVGEQYRGQGIAKIMYDWVKELGYKIQRSPDQSPAGKYFWDKNRGEVGQIWEAEQKQLDPEIYGEELPLSTIKRIIQSVMSQVDPTAKLTIKRTPEGYIDVHSDNGLLTLIFGITADGGEIGANIDKAYSSYKGKGVVTAIIGQCFKAAEKRWGKPEAFSINPYEDRGHGVWQAMAQKLGARYASGPGTTDPTASHPDPVNEIARIPQSELGDWGEKGTLEPPKTPVKKKELPGGSGYTYAVEKTGKGDLEIMIFDGEKLAAELDLFETQDVLHTWGVETIVVERPYRGQGLGKALYGIALSILKLTIEAGQTQTRHGQQMWLMLNSIPGVEVKGYTMVPTAKYQPNKNDTIVKQDAEWTRYTFPVKPGSSSMRSGRRGTGIYTSQASMIARWTGQ